MKLYSMIGISANVNFAKTWLSSLSSYELYIFTPITQIKWTLIDLSHHLLSPFASSVLLTSTFIYTNSPLLSKAYIHMTITFASTIYTMAYYWHLFFLPHLKNTKEARIYRSMHTWRLNICYKSIGALLFIISLKNNRISHYQVNMFSRCQILYYLINHHPLSIFYHIILHYNILHLCLHCFYFILSNNYIQLAQVFTSTMIIFGDIFVQLFWKGESTSKNHPWTIVS